MSPPVYLNPFIRYLHPHGGINQVISETITLTVVVVVAVVVVVIDVVVVIVFVVAVVVDVVVPAVDVVVVHAVRLRCRPNL